ncbi:MAG: hypothetical protein LAT80_08160 [Balneolaceae bacterium]|nr:hypothetical protein [Balneolaceae bacterium]
MKILYGIQGTGHGHISRAREIIPQLAEQASIDVLVSGYNFGMKLDEVEKVTYKRGLSLTYDDQGGVSYLQTGLNVQPITFLRDLNSVSPDQYDLVITDYESISAWASVGSDVPCIGLSHQAAFLSEASPRPQQRSPMAELILKRFAPCNKPIGFHFRRYDSFIEPPVIREQIRDLQPVKGKHITVYLPAYSHDALIPAFKSVPQTEWELFSPLCNEPFKAENVTVFPVGNLPFLESLRGCHGVLTSAGFETCSEAMFLGKKLFAIPIRNQYEQYCNAAALNKLGVRTSTSVDETFAEKADKWINHDTTPQLTEIADTSRLARRLLRFVSNRSSRYSQVV